MSVKELLKDEIESQIEGMADVAIGSEEYKIASDGLTKLLDKLNEMDRLELDREAKLENQEIVRDELDLKTKQLEEEQKDHKIKNGLTAVSIVGGFALTIWGTFKTLKFEETGTVTTNAGRAFINKLFPKK